MCGDYKSSAWKVGNPPVADEVDDDLDYLKQPLAVPPDPVGEIELHSSFSSSDFISLGDHHLGWLKANFPQQYSKPVIAFERPQFKTKTGPALEEDISYFDDLFSAGLPSPTQERKTDQKLQSPLKDYGTRGNIYVENEHKQQQQCLANVENIDKRVEHNKDKNKQYFYTKSIGDDENSINFINDDNELEGMESNILLANKKIGSKRGWSKSKQQEQWSRNFGSGDENEPFNYMSKKRMCSHCKAEKTPQWRVGPLGPKTLCNACGVRYKSGRLVPGYRPAASPTFDTSKHSNFHRKIIKRRDGFIL